FDLSADDAYADPGSPLMARHPDGTRTVLQDDSAIYLCGDGATPEGDRPFLDRLDLTGMQQSRLFQSPPDAFAQVLGFVAGGREQVLVWHESRSEPPNLVIVPLDGSAPRQLTSWPDPHPQLTSMDKRLVTHDRGDGVQLSGMLHLPPGYDPACDGRLPLVVWAYPLDYGSAAAAAHIAALDAMGIVDPGRVAVGGHSYGAFMTANLLAHTDLFAAGIARSGAYNRSLTPFGFQTERR